MAAYSWPSGSTCPGCDTPLQLTGTGFQDSDVLARFVLVCMSLVVAFGCVVYSVASRLFLTFGAAFATAVYLALVVLTDTVTEKSMTTTYAFFIVNVFVVASGYLAVILTLAALGQLVGARLAIPSFVLAVLALVSVGMTIRETNYLVNLLYSLKVEYDLFVQLRRQAFIVDLVFRLAGMFTAAYVVILSKPYGVFAAVFLIVRMLCAIALDGVYLTLWDENGNVQRISQSSSHYLNVAPGVESLLQSIVLVLLVIEGLRVSREYVKVDRDYV